MLARRRLAPCHRLREGGAPWVQGKGMAGVPSVLSVASVTSAVLCAFAASVAVGCGSASKDYDLPVGFDDAGGSFVGGDASAEPLDAYIQENEVQISIVTVSCAGECATVQAVATGGNPPYTFSWDDGSTSTVRTVCPAANTHYSVKATDTATTGEVPRPAQSVQVPLEANVLRCPDGGGAVEDAGDCQTILVVTPPSSTLMGPGAVSCSSGSTGAITAFGVSVPLAAGQEYEIDQDVTGMLLLGSPAPLWDLYAASSTCSATTSGQHLGSLTFDPGTPHESFCFTANANYAAIDWTSNAIAAGVGQGVYQLCKGCGQPAQSP
jgi:SprB repeat